MPDLKLGTKFACFSCGLKFYDLGRGEPICPKCGANQNDAGEDGAPTATPPARRKRKPEVRAKPVKKNVDDEIDDEALDADLGTDDELPADLGNALGDEEEDEEDEEEEADDEA
jgi:uncharacterized protein (TIGR02300 family)